MKQSEYTVFRGRVGDHNNLAMPGAQAIGALLRQRVGVDPIFIGSPEPALNVGWHAELEAAMPQLLQLQVRIAGVLERGAYSVAAVTRCAAAMATLPAVVQHRPGVCIVWFDSHADLNTPAASTTGYLGGLALAAPAGLWDSGLGAGLALDQIVLVGQRDLDPFESELIDRNRIALIRPGDDLSTALRAAIGGRPVYVHLDCDVLNPGIVPTDYVLEGGLSLEDLRLCCEVIAENDVVGIEIAEFQNSWSEGGPPVSPGLLLDALAALL